jgi:hypothetical protein
VPASVPPVAPGVPFSAPEPLPQASSPMAVSVVSQVRLFVMSIPSEHLHRADLASEIGRTCANK